MSQQFCLKWNNHTTNMLQVFESLLSTEALVDVTLACDGLSLKAHKMVLSACSPFFQSLFLENPCKHPIVIMKDMRYCDLKAIIDFMYRGEVNVSHDQLSALLKTAETLKVKGLAEVTGENRHASGIVQQEITQQQQSAVSTPTPTPLTPTAQRTDTPPLQGKRKRGRPRKRSLSDSNRSDDEGVAAKIKDRDSPDVEELSGDASMDATSDIRSGGGPGSSNSQSQVPSHSSNNVNSFSKSHLSISQEPQVDDTSGDENEFEVEPSKLLEQTLTTDNVPSSSQNSTGHIQLPSVSGLEISRRSMSSTDSLSQALVPASDSLGSNLQAPDSPQDIKPQILSFDDPPISPVAGPSHSERSMMMYMDQSGVSSIPGPSNYQDNSALVPHDSHPQGKKKFAVVKFLGTNSVEVIPVNWLINKNQCKWPSKSSSKYISKCIRECAKSQENWETLNLTVYYLTNNFKSADEKAQEALETSDISAESSSEEEVHVRKKKKPARYRDSLDDGQMEKLFINSSKDLSIQQISSRSDVTSGGNISSQQLKKQCSLPKVYLSKDSSKIKESPEVKTMNITNMFTMMTKMFKSLEDIQKEVKDVKSHQSEFLNPENVASVVNQTHGNSSFLLELPEGVHLPIPDDGALIELDKKLREDTNMQSVMIRYFNCICSGKTSSAFLTNICKHLLSKEVAVQYSRLGRKGKKSFETLPALTNVILNVTSKRFPKMTRQEVAEKFGKVLATAADWEGRKLKAKDALDTDDDSNHNVYKMCISNTECGNEKETDKI